MMKSLWDFSAAPAGAGARFAFNPRFHRGLLSFVAPQLSDWFTGRTNRFTLASNRFGGRVSRLGFFGTVWPVA